MMASAHIAPFTVTRLEVDQAESSPKQSGVSPCPVKADVSEQSPLYTHGPVAENEMNVIKHVIDHLSLGLDGINAGISQRLATARNAALARRRS